MATIYEREFGQQFLDSIIEWVTGNFGINDLFDNEEIEKWLKYNAEDFGYVKEVE